MVAKKVNDNEEFTQWFLAEKAVESGQPVLLYGRPGIGKTKLGHIMAARLKKKLFIEHITPGKDASELRGFYLPNGKGGVEWMDGPGIAAMKAGGIYLIDEGDKAGPDVEAAMHFFLDCQDVAQLSLPDVEGTLVRPAPGYQVVVTMNGEPEDLAPAIRSRLTVQIRLDTPNPSAVEALAEDIRPFANGTAQSVMNDGMDMDLRKLFAFQSVRSIYGDKLAANLLFANCAAEFLQVIELNKAK